MNNTERKPGYYRIITERFKDGVIVEWDGFDFYHLEKIECPIMPDKIISIIETPITPSPELPTETFICPNCGHIEEYTTKTK